MSGTKAKTNLWSRPRYDCSFPGCDLQFKRKDRLDAHEFTHTQSKKYKCTEENCTKSYTNSSHLQRHIRTFHTKQDQIVQCAHESCGKFFDTEDRAKAHYNSIHSEKMRKFQCESCPERFHRKTKLKQHTFDMHTGDYRYSCDKCGKGFLLMSHLKRHKKSHTTLKCEHCEATFEKWSLLMAHKNKEHQNSDLKCTTCNLEFHSKRVLKAHAKTHANLDDQNVHHCTFDGCSKFFWQKRNLLAHCKSKHENQKFACTFEGCMLELSTKQKLELHIKVVHSSDANKNPQDRKTAQAERKDKGVQKKSTASKLFNFILPPEFERVIIAGQGKNIHIDYNSPQDGDDDNQQQNTDLDTNQLATVRIVECCESC